MSNLIVKINDGELRGAEITHENGVKYISFTGIPYAEPPAGNLRFKDPVPKEPWSGIKDATKKGNPAPQFYSIFHIYIGEEDCLFLDVHTPQLPSKDSQLMPVMVYIHGGGFANGSANDGGPEHLMGKGIVLVNINYRLGIFGFLCTDSKNATGDMGLKDQNLALKWVQKNISAFNGDPNNVTLFGISAGSASVEYQLLSSQSSGLFHKAILQSGSCLNPWARTRNGVEKAKRVAEELGYKGGDLFSFLNSFSTKELVIKSNIILDSNATRQGEFFAFTPVINELEGYEGFISGEPIDLLKNGDFSKVPTIWGICNREGLLHPMFYMGEVLKELKDAEFDKCMPDFLVHDRKELKNKLDTLYKGDIIDFTGDVFISGGVWASVALRSKHKNSEYAYTFSYSGNINFGKNLIKATGEGASHGDDTGYVFQIHLPIMDYANQSDTDTKVQSIVTNMWTNFAKTGDPTPNVSGVINEKWIQATKDDRKYLDISSELKMQENLWPERVQLWTELYNKTKK